MMCPVIDVMNDFIKKFAKDDLKDRFILGFRTELRTVKCREYRFKHCLSLWVVHMIELGPVKYPALHEPGVVDHCYVIHDTRIPRNLDPGDEVVMVEDKVCLHFIPSSVSEMK